MNRMRNAQKLLSAALVAMLLLVPSGQAAAATTYYIVQDLGALPGDSSSVAWGINQQGDVVGWSNGPNGTRAFVFTDAGGMVALPGLPDKPRTLARRINDSGDIVGTANAGGTDLGHAVRWRGGIIKDLGTLAAGAYSEGWGINNFGDVVGESYTDGGSFVGVHAFLYTDANGMVDLTPTSDTGRARDINDARQVTGYKTALGGYHAFRWTSGIFQDLGVLPGFADSFGYAIEASGRVAGSSSNAYGNSEHLFRFTDGVGMQDLGGVGEHNTAWSINGAGNVVGALGQSASRAFLYTDEAGLKDLNTLIDPSLGWVLLGAFDINDAGQIVGYGFNNFTQTTHAVRLQPTSTPPSECSFNCLRSTAINLTAKTVHRVVTVKGQVTVRDENGNPVPEALIAATWTLPNGTTQSQNAWTDSKGLALFSTSLSRGTYTLTVVNIVKSLYTFNPSKSVLSKSITVK
jgi:probable HAF family extracellular repeat protein